MVAREGGERADRNACRGQNLRHACEKADDVPSEFDVERDEPEPALDTRVARRVSHRAPVVLFKQQRHLYGVAQEHEG